MSKPFTAAVVFVLIAPAALFLLAVLDRSVAPINVAQSIVTWYSGRVWTPWVLLLLLPLGAFMIGGTALIGDRGSLAVAGRGATAAVATATLAAGVILVVVVLHMLAN